MDDYERKKRKRYLNMVFFGIFLIEIIFGIIGVFVLPARADYLIVLISVIFVSGVYTIFEKTIITLLAFCVINMLPIVILMDIMIGGSFSEVNKPNRVGDFMEEIKNETLVINVKTRYIKEFVIPNVIAVSLATFFNILFATLLVISWQNKYWNIISRPKIPIPNNLKKPYLLYRIYNTLLYITLCFIVTLNSLFILNIKKDSNMFGIYIFIIFCPFFTLMFSPNIIKQELKVGMFLVYSALITQSLLYSLIIVVHRSKLTLDATETSTTLEVMTLMLLVSLFANTVLCHRNFGKNLKYYCGEGDNLNLENGEIVRLDEKGSET